MPGPICDRGNKEVVAEDPHPAPAAITGASISSSVRRQDPAVIIAVSPRAKEDEVVDEVVPPRARVSDQTMR